MSVYRGSGGRHQHGKRGVVEVFPTVGRPQGGRRTQVEAADARHGGGACTTGPGNQGHLLNIVISNYYTLFALVT